MFEVGFTEIVLILGLALLVLGPEKLPALAQKIGRWTGRARSMARQLRTQLEQEVTLEELSKSKPMQAPQPTATNAAEPNVESVSPSGFDLDKHFDEIDTSPEAMHRNDVPTDSETIASVDSEPHFPEVDTTPEAMHAPIKDKTAS
jgi:sec-independent protein translocase protein TatB